MVALELCTEDLAGALVAERLGIDRIELCSALSEGGVTVSLGWAQATLGALERTDVQFLIRPRPGHFVYDERELRVMESDITAISALDHAPGVRVGFVVGALTHERQIDTATARRLVQACAGAPVTFHRAFDLVEDQMRALEQLAACGVRRVLTAGGAPTALEGAATLAALVDAAGADITILAAGGIRPHNILEVIARSGVHEIHFALRSTVAGASPAAGAVTLVGAPVPVDAVAHTDAAAVESLLAALGHAGLLTPGAGR